MKSTHVIGLNIVKLVAGKTTLKTKKQCQKGMTMNGIMILG